MRHLLLMEFSASYGTARAKVKSVLIFLLQLLIHCTPTGGDGAGRPGDAVFLGKGAGGGGILQPVVHIALDVGLYLVVAQGGVGGQAFDAGERGTVAEHIVVAALHQGGGIQHGRVLQRSAVVKHIHIAAFRKRGGRKGRRAYESGAAGEHGLVTARGKVRGG